MLLARFPVLASRSLRWRSGQCEVCLAWCSNGLCSPCQRRFAAPQPRCRRCAIRTTPGQGECLACTLHPPPFSATLCVADYQFPWDRLLHRLKYGGEPGMAKVLAPLMNLARANHPTPLQPTSFIPMPLSPQRAHERGYNQALELARSLSTHGRQPLLGDALWRVIESDHAQASLTRAERLQALRGAFMCNPRRQKELEGRHLTLVDDVLTTGATAAQAAHVLLRAGAAQVDVLVFARTPKPDTFE